MFPQWRSNAAGLGGGIFRADGAELREQAGAREGTWKTWNVLNLFDFQTSASFKGRFYADELSLRPTPSSL